MCSRLRSLLAVSVCALAMASFSIEASAGKKKNTKDRTNQTKKKSAKRIFSRANRLDATAKKKLKALDEAIETASEARKSAHNAYQKATQAAAEAIRKAKDREARSKAYKAYREASAAGRKGMSEALDEYRKAIDARHKFFREALSRRSAGRSKKKTTKTKSKKRSVFANRLDEAEKKNLKALEQAIDEASKARKAAYVAYRAAIKAAGEAYQKAKGREARDKVLTAYRQALGDRKGMNKALGEYRKAISARQKFLREALSGRPAGKSKKKTARPKSKEAIAYEKAKQTLNQATKNWFKAMRVVFDFRRNRATADDPKTKANLNELQAAVEYAYKARKAAYESWRDASLARVGARRKAVIHKKKESDSTIVGG